MHRGMQQIILYIHTSTPLNVNDVIHERINKHHNNLEAHPNPLLQPLLEPLNTRRPRRCWPL